MQYTVSPPFRFVVVVLISIYLFLTVLGLCCSEWASHCSGFSYCRAQALRHVGWGVVAPRLECVSVSSWGAGA